LLRAKSWPSAIHNGFEEQPKIHLVLLPSHILILNQCEALYLIESSSGTVLSSGGNIASYTLTECQTYFDVHNPYRIVVLI
jgi:hypothetical protein